MAVSPLPWREVWFSSEALRAPQGFFELRSWETSTFLAWPRVCHRIWKLSPSSRINPRVQFKLVLQERRLIPKWSCLVFHQVPKHRCLLSVKMPDGILLVLPGPEGIVYKIQRCHAPFWAADGSQSGKPYSISAALDAYLQAAEWSHKVELTLFITCLQFGCLHPRQVLLASFALSGAIHVSILWWNMGQDWFKLCVTMKELRQSAQRRHLHVHCSDCSQDRGSPLRICSFHYFLAVKIWTPFLIIIGWLKHA